MTGTETTLRHRIIDVSVLRFEVIRIIMRQ